METSNSISFIFKGIKMLSRWRLKDSNLVFVALNDTSHISPHSTIQCKSSSNSAVNSSLSKKSGMLSTQAYQRNQLCCQLKPIKEIRYAGICSGIIRINSNSWKGTIPKDIDIHQIQSGSQNPFLRYSCIDAMWWRTDHQENLNNSPILKKRFNDGNNRAPNDVRF